MKNTASHLDFQLLFEQAPALFLVLGVDPDFTILGASEAYLKATLTQRSIVGRPLFDVFPENPDDTVSEGVQNLRSSLHRAIASKAPDTMPLQKYDIPRPAEEGGGFEERYWSPVNAPILSPAGKVLWILHRVDDVTDFVRGNAVGSNLPFKVLTHSREIEDNNKKLISLNEELEEKNQKLESFQRITLDREQRVIELKNEINRLLSELGRPEKFGKNLK